jgi:hypothetical protein
VTKSRFTIEKHLDKNNTIIRNFCEQKGTPYEAIDENGEIHIALGENMKAMLQSNLIVFCQEEIPKRIT